MTDFFTPDFYQASGNNHSSIENQESVYFVINELQQQIKDNSTDLFKPFVDKLRITLIMREISDPVTNLDKIENFALSEPGIPSVILRAATNTMYNPDGEQVDSLRQAIDVIGIDGLFRILVGYGSPTHNALGTHQKQIIDHSIAVAYACYDLACLRGNSNPLEFYLLGLLSGVGKLVVHTALVRNDIRLDNQTLRSGGGDIAKELTLLSQQITVLNVKQWSLPSWYEDAYSRQCYNKNTGKAEILSCSNLLAEVYYKYSTGDFDFEPALKLVQSKGFHLTHIKHLFEFFDSFLND